MNRRKKIIVALSAAILIIGSIAALLFYFHNRAVYKKLFATPNVSIRQADTALYIPTGSTKEYLVAQLLPLAADTATLRAAADERLKSEIHPGKYTVKNGWTNSELIALFNHNREDEVTVKFYNLWTLPELASVVSRQIEADSLSIIEAFRDPIFLSENSLNPENAGQVVMPYTYRFYWGTSGEQFRDRMMEEYRKFWNEKRLAKADSIGLTPSQAIVLASIIQKEVARNDEAPRIAGVYMNRIKKGWKLQSCPTVIYSKKQTLPAFTPIHRVYSKDLGIDSPYNTYKNPGLPPAPISFPEAIYIDAVLNYEPHNYMFMCASTKRPGYHEFSTSAYQHYSNRSEYVRYLNKNGIGK